MVDRTLPINKHVRIVLPSEREDYFQLMNNLMEIRMNQLLFLPWGMVNGSLISDFLCVPRDSNFRSYTRRSHNMCTPAVVSELYIR